MSSAMPPCTAPAARRHTPHTPPLQHRSSHFKALLVTLVAAYLLLFTYLYVLDGAVGCSFQFNDRVQLCYPLQLQVLAGGQGVILGLPAAGSCLLRNGQVCLVWSGEEVKQTSAE
jgi:hypothetical protein